MLNAPRDFQNVKIREGINNIKIDLKYFNGAPVIKRIKRISKPGIRVYSKIKRFLAFCVRIVVFLFSVTILRFSHFFLDLNPGSVGSIHVTEIILKW